MVKVSFLKKQTFYILFLLNSIVIIAYLKSFGGFFQQDEWLAFSRLSILQNSNFVEVLSNIFLPSGLHYNPFNLFLLLFSFAINGLNYHGYAGISLIFHLLTVNLVFYFYLLLFKNRLYAFLSATFFGVLAASSQATNWVIADSGTHSATIWGLISLILVYRYIYSSKIKFLIFAIGSIFISLLFKEITIGLFVTLPLFIYIYRKDKKNKYWKTYIFIAITGIVFLLFRFMVNFEYSAQSGAVLDSQRPRALILNLITLPVKSLAQTLILPDKLLYLINGIYKDIANSLLFKYDSFVFFQNSENIYLEIFNLLLIIVITSVVIYRFVNSKDQRFRQNIIFSIIFIGINSLIFAIAPERSGVIHILDSRNVYFISIGTILLLSSILFELFKKNSLAIISIFIVLIIINFFWLGEIIDNQNKVGHERKLILSTIKKSYPALHKKTIFYTESDTPFYGLSEEERILPFQSGFGQTLLIWYEPDEKFPIPFFRDKFLWNITDQGYKEIQSRGFGYFRDFSKLSETIMDRQLPLNSVIAYSYSSETKMVTDITKQIRGRLAGFKVSQNQKPISDFNIEASDNSKDVILLKDKNRVTYWDSKKPYNHIQTLEIDLGAEKPVSHIKIDSYNNKDQDKVGYEVLTSNNKTDWKSVFYSKRYPPSREGIVNLYFKPDKVQFIKIRQIGKHQYASWVINELNIFDSMSKL